MVTNLDAATGLIRRAIEGFVDGSPDIELFSDQFGIHEGRSLPEWIDHEIGEFEKRGHAFAMGRGLEVAIDRYSHDGSTSFSVKNGNGDIVYQDTWWLDGRGRITGNGMLFEIVSKLQFKKGELPRRAMAIRSVRGGIISVVPLGLAADDCILKDAMNSDADGFATFSMHVPDDDLKGFPARFRIADDAGTRASELVWMRGTDDFPIEADLFPTIHGSFVTVPGTARLWELNVALDDGTKECFEHPLPGTFEFDTAVSSAVLTDIWDNDWQTVL